MTFARILLILDSPGYLPPPYTSLTLTQYPWGIPGDDRGTALEGVSYRFLESVDLGVGADTPSIIWGSQNDADTGTSAEGGTLNAIVGDHSIAQDSGPPLIAFARSELGRWTEGRTSRSFLARGEAGIAMDTSLSKLGVSHTGKVSESAELSGTMNALVGELNDAEISMEERP